MQRHRLTVTGIVQGVGFRPFIYQLAQRLELAGWVCNDPGGVTIEVQGPAATLARFTASVGHEKPPLAAIHELTITEVPVADERGFTIKASSSGSRNRAQIPADTNVCEDCLREMFEPRDRRYRYPFINCTNCGPRYTIITNIPYDRPLTTMVDFPMCSDCRAEYDDPGDRRFHAQPNACPVCGPQLALIDKHGKRLPGEDVAGRTVDLLRAGHIVAIKGLGGYHLAVDAANPAAVAELRCRKQRDEKPFALMVKDLAAARRIAHVAGDEVRFLTGVERPIVLLAKRTGHGLAETVAPDNRYFGVMLPYTPLHHLLLEQGFRALVMTSANLSDEPIAFLDDEARERLADIADYFVTHNRRIHTRTDDSITRVMAGRPLVMRRSRGFVPRTVTLPECQESVLAVGAELKNTVCLTREDQAFLSQHIGDLKNLDVCQAFKESIEHLSRILEITPGKIAHDLHPDYYASRYAVEESGLPAVAVQHHHAHLASCLAEHGCHEPAIGLIFDGLGYGADGRIWGGEFLVGDLAGYRRWGHFRYQPMPGGDLATREPWRMTLSYLQTAFGELPVDSPVFAGIPPAELRLVAQATAKGINAPLTSSCGRLFDAVAALLGLRQRVSFEGQAALALEMCADPDAAQPLPYGLDQDGQQILFDPIPLVRALCEERAAGTDTATLAGRFHATLAEMMLEVCTELRARTGLGRVVLSGGVFQNCLLTKRALDRLGAAGFDILTHSLIPPNDGGLALGQAAVAARKDA